MSDSNEYNRTFPQGVTVVPYGGKWPVIPDSVMIAPGARIIGDVVFGERASVWYNVVIRGDVHYIRIGEDSNIQDGSVLHVTHDTAPLVIGDRVTVGHAVKLHGCTVKDEALIGIGSIVLDGAVVESRSMVAAGAVVAPGFVVPSGTLVAGVPARVRRDLRKDELENFAPHAERYVNYATETRKDLPVQR
jgi:carbonic anhydrase/acetyltransferase-like protein (isoleucine patch superfamily)